jgi:hypothetical protein
VNWLLLLLALQKCIADAFKLLCFVCCQIAQGSVVCCNLGLLQQRERKVLLNAR